MIWRMQSERKKDDKMKRLCVAGLMVVLAVQTASAFDFGLHGSWWDPSDADEAFGPGLRMLADTVPVEFRASYYGDVDVKGGPSLDIIPIEAGLVLGLDRIEALDLALGGGVSYHILDADHGDVDNEFGWYGTFHVEIPLEGTLSIFAELMYRGVEVGDVNADLDGSVINVGIIIQ